jgi:hypothetical protein
VVTPTVVVREYAVKVFVPMVEGAVAQVGSEI